MHYCKVEILDLKSDAKYKSGVVCLFLQFGASALHYAAKANSEEVVAFLIDKGAPVNGADNVGHWVDALRGTLECNICFLNAIARTPCYFLHVYNIQACTDDVYVYVKLSFPWYTHDVASFLVDGSVHWLI